MQDQDKDTLAAVRRLFAEQRWEDVVRLAETEAAASAELNYHYGVALARLGRLDAAREALLNGCRLKPLDKRFPIELAGVAFKQKHYSKSVHWLRRALEIDPADAYGNDFLGSVYFLEGNLEAALKYWNRVSKPLVANVRLPELRVNPVLLDRAFAFSAASTLRLDELLVTRKRLRNLAIFPKQTLDLSANADGTFDVAFRASERNGFGNNKREALFRLFRGIFQETLYPEYFNVGGSAVNIVSSLRWDAQKRRLLAYVAGPLRRDPRRRYQFGVDLRNENWELLSSFSGPARRFGALNLRRDSVSAGITMIPAARWDWSTGVELSRREFRSVLAGTVLTPELLAEGFQLKHLAELNYEWLRVPEKRLLSTVTVSSQLGRVWSAPSQAFAKLQAELTVGWFPQSRGDDYEVTGSLRAGKTSGRTPFDELFVLGVKGDTGLKLRAHVATRDDRKGSAPMGRDYVLTNLEIDKRVLRKRLVTVKLGPFLDSGYVTGSSADFAAKRWLWDTGAQAKVHAMGATLIFVYGRDLRMGRNAWYVTVGR